MGTRWMDGCDGQDMDVAPGSVFAARSWLYAEDGNYLPLHGLYGNPWGPGEQVADCESGGTIKEPHAAPYAECGCGFWAYWHPAFVGEHISAIEGVVECYGRTLIGTRGCRSEKARIVALAIKSIPPQGPNDIIIPTSEKIDEAVKSYYHVPVFNDAAEMYANFPVSGEYCKETPAEQPMYQPPSYITLNSSTPLTFYSGATVYYPTTTFSLTSTTSATWVWEE